MTIPDFQSLMLPLLQLASDGNEHSITEAIEKLSQHFGLNEADRDELLPSGKQRKFDRLADGILLVNRTLKRADRQNAQDGQWNHQPNATPQRFLLAHLGNGQRARQR